MEAVQNGIPKSIVAEAYRVSRLTVYRWLDRLERDGAAGLEPQPGSGRPRKLEEWTQQRLKALVLHRASRYGFETDLWTVGRLRRVIREQYGLDLSGNTVSRRLREAGLAYQKPERAYYEIHGATREAWLANDVPQIRATVNRGRANPCFHDESRTCGPWPSWERHGLCAAKRHDRR